MADNDQNDEYKFDEIDSFENESLETSEFGEKKTSPPRESGEKKNIKRNALIAVGLIVFAMLMYKFIGGMFSTTPAPKNGIPPAPIAEVPPTPQPPITKTEIPPQPIQPEPQPQAQPQPVAQQPPPAQENNAVLEQKVASIETSQQTVQSEVSSMNQQVGNVNNNVNVLSSQITKLNMMISNLNNQVAKQSEVINILMERTKPKIIKRIVRTQVVIPQIIYYINAVIPGRAWLIGSNGSTLTVREGTKIVGYGSVRLIDSMQGRILTSSGRVIKFSQADS